MNTSKKKQSVVLAIIVIALVAMAVFWGIPNINSIDSPETSIQDKAVLALKDIIGFDLTNYNVNISTHIDTNQLSNYNGSKVEDLNCNLQSDQGKFYATMKFVNGSLFYLDLSTDNGSLLSEYYTKQLPADPIDASKVLLGRLSEFYSNPSYFKPMLDSLNSNVNLNSVNATIGNMKRQEVVQTQFIQVSQIVNYTSTSTSIRFMYSFGDALDSPKSISFNFRDGIFEGFSNGWQLYKIGSQNVTISREQAINMALEQGNNATSNELKLRNESIRADLRLLAEEPFVLYPFWFVELPLASPQTSSAGNYLFGNYAFTEWQVGIWADTGMIEYSHPA